MKEILPGHSVSGTEAMASFAGMSLEEYWGEIINACYLDDENPIKRWQETEATLHTLKKLTDMEIEWVYVVGEDANIKIKIGEKENGSLEVVAISQVFEKSSPVQIGGNKWLDTLQYASLLPE